MHGRTLESAFMRSYVLFPVGAAALTLAACGGGGGASSTAAGPESNTPLAAASLTAKPLAGNKVELGIGGVGAASRVCVRQGSTQPLAGDACFSDADSLKRVQQKDLSGSATQADSFSAWLLAGSTVSLHGRVSVPGKTCSAAAYTASSASALPTVCFITGEGESVLALEPTKAPITVANFLRYVNQGFYDQTVFHRFLKGGLDVVQGGGYVYSNGSYLIKPSTQAAIPLESTLSSGLSNTAGTIAMARTGDPDSATAGFFVNTTNNSGPFNSSTSRNGYAVFGSFIHGQDSWATLLSKVSGGPEVVQPATPVALQWVYQIK